MCCDGPNYPKATVLFLAGSLALVGAVAAANDKSHDIVADVLAAAQTDHHAAAPEKTKDHGSGGHEEPSDHSEPTGHGEVDHGQDGHAHGEADTADGGHGHHDDEPVGEPDAADIARQMAVDAYIQALDPAAANGANLRQIDGLQPYQLIRSLQFVQDSVVRGDHSAMDMQRFLLGVVDERLRRADQQVFDNPRNVDAALIYAMSGGNPATLDLLALRDRFGNFDNEVTTVLRAYLDGRAAHTQTSLDEILAIYRNTDIGPYLALIAANVKAGLNQDGALEMFDWARLGAPGTIIEEAALRRSLFVAAKKGQVDRAFHYVTLYARRFITSPYAGQYADQVVQLVVDHYDQIGEEQLRSVLMFMDTKRRREVYLRIARKAAINGQRELARLAADEAKSLSHEDDLAPAALAGLYGNLAEVPSDDVAAVDADLAALEEVPLSPRDKALRDAARLIANEITKEPDPNSLTQAFSPKMGGQEDAETVSVEAEKPGAPGTAESADGSNAGEAKGEEMAPDEKGQDVASADPEFQDYLESRSKILDEIDGLLASDNGVEKQ